MLCQVGSKTGSTAHRSNDEKESSGVSGRPSSSGAPPAPQCRLPRHSAARLRAGCGQPTARYKPARRSWHWVFYVVAAMSTATGR